MKSIVDLSRILTLKFKCFVCNKWISRLSNKDFIYFTDQNKATIEKKRICKDCADLFEDMKNIRNPHKNVDPV